MKSVRFSVFSDLHYRDGNWNQASERLDSIQKRAAENKVDFVIHCGDFCHNVVTGKEIIDRYNHFSIPSYHTIGNHDFEQTDGLEIVCRAFGMKNSYYSFDVNSFRIISLDTNFYRSDPPMALLFTMHPEIPMQSVIRRNFMFHRRNWTFCGKPLRRRKDLAFFFPMAVLSVLTALPIPKRS